MLQQRYGEKLQLQFDIPELGGTLPPLCLQILVENAVKHNVISQRHPLTIEIKKQGNQLLVSNPIQAKRKPENGSGFGLEAIRRRYQLVGNQDINISKNDGLFCVTLPLLK